MSQEIMHIVANSMDILDVKKSCVNNCNKWLELEIDLFKKKDFVEKEAYDKLVKSYSNLEKHCILVELATQLNQEIFQRENSGENLNAPTFNQLFEINELKAQSQEMDTVIRKLKEIIKSLSGKDNMGNVKKDIDEIETITLFARCEGKDILLVQIYVDDIIFASTKPDLCETPRGTFLNQSKYTLESLKKYGMETYEPADTPMVKKSKLDEDPQEKFVDPTCYRGMIGTLMYLTAVDQTLLFDVCMLCRLSDIAYRKALTCAFVDADHAGCQVTKKSASGSMQMIDWFHLMRESRLAYKFQTGNHCYTGRERDISSGHRSVKNSTWLQSFPLFLQIVPNNIYAAIMNFMDVPDDDTTLTFLIDLGYKGPLYKHTNMFVVHIHQPWENLVLIINKCSLWKMEQIHLKKRRGKGSQGKKIADDSQEITDVSEEYDPKPEPAKRKTSSKRKVKKKVTLSADDNIISDDPDTNLELGKSIRQTKAEEAEASKQVCATH
ncbi:hypothetical protein Tco_1468096, partial [Tanacetum coccineum]